jgi:hypothetical protein
MDAQATLQAMQQQLQQQVQDAAAAAAAAAAERERLAREWAVQRKAVAAEAHSQVSGEAA